MKSYLVGRGQKQGRKADIVLADSDTSVSGIHLELLIEKAGRYYVTDYNSINGTFHIVDNQWQPLKQAYIKLDEPLLLGRYQTCVRKILEQRPAERKPPPKPKPAINTDIESIQTGSVERDPETGDIIPAQKY
ncbi:FHA domain-containing protein [Candidatus Venteria ishoeyi]|uniref:FHA domain protein n=1 Tax=Candidatus Venteria ishoeyi TaxID=1899563 RepID=A0A1H6FF18_9GAMM|nr:FHA domain-containing protein [Candidatus Venteria ishoeyi]SEH08662.1 FHA domain protein [Candidatus Venteria ishoeyi]